MKHNLFAQPPGMQKARAQAPSQATIAEVETGRLWHESRPGLSGSAQPPLPITPEKEKRRPPREPHFSSCSIFLRSDRAIAAPIVDVAPPAPDQRPLHDDERSLEDCRAAVRRSQIQAVTGAALTVPAANGNPQLDEEQPDGVARKMQAGRCGNRRGNWGLAILVFSNRTRGPALQKMKIPSR